MYTPSVFTVSRTVDRPSSSQLCIPPRAPDRLLTRAASRPIPEDSGGLLGWCTGCRFDVKIRLGHIPKTWEPRGAELLFKIRFRATSCNEAGTRSRESGTVFRCALGSVQVGKWYAATYTLCRVEVNSHFWIFLSWRVRMLVTSAGSWS